MADAKKSKSETARKVGDATKEEIRDAVEGVMSDVFEKGMLPKDAMGLSDSMVEGIYGHAYRLYNSGQYREASQLFRLLVMLNATEPKYVLGLAACYHLLGEYDNALMTYSVVEVLNPEDPMPCYHASDCYANLGLMDLAFDHLEYAREKCGNLPEYAILKDRIKLTVKNMKEVGKGDANKEEDEGVQEKKKQKKPATKGKEKA